MSGATHTHLDNKITKPIHKYAWLKERAFATPFDTLMTLCFLSILVYLGYLFVDWAFINAVWGVESVALCSEASGACCLLLMRDTD